MKHSQKFLDLQKDAKAFVFKLRNRKRVTMWTYKRDDLGKNWSLSQLYERVAAGAQLGFDVQLHAEEGGLRVEYVERTPVIPWSLL